LLPFNGATAAKDRYWAGYTSFMAAKYPLEPVGTISGTPFLGQLVDAIFAMALSFQDAINSNNGLTGSQLRAAHFDSLINNLSFEGITGLVEFDFQGDMQFTRFSLKNYYQEAGVESTSWSDVGSVVGSLNDEALNTSLNYNDIIWPDGSTGKTTSYSQQLMPHCPAGYEPIFRGDRFECMACSVLFYKPNEGPEHCTPCSEGMLCNDVGIIVPCVESHYWRYPPPEGEEGDFSRYEVFRCYHDDACLGGCDLSSSCSTSRQQLSPTCGVCAEGHYLDQFSSCDECTVRDLSSTLLLYSFTLLVLVLVLAAFFNAAVQPPTDNVVDDEVSKPESSRSHQRKLVLEKMSVVAVGVGDLMPKFISTMKLMIGFTQVVSGSLQSLDLNLSNDLRYMLWLVNFNPMAIFSADNRCSHEETFSFFDELVLYLMFPFLLVLIFTCVGGAVYWLKVAKSSHATDEAWHRNVSIKLWNVYFKLILWTALVLFPALSTKMLSAFVQRDFNYLGIFLQADYSVDCETHKYRMHLIVASFGILLYTLGIPILFFLCIRNRHHELLVSPARVLHMHFKSGWSYYDIYDSFRKLLLTSIVLFVADPSSPSRALFLLSVNAGALVVLAATRPYKYRGDDLLSFSLITIEFGIFLMALLLLTDAVSIANYSRNGILTGIFVFILSAFLCFMPLTWLIKLRSLQESVLKITGARLRKSTRVSGTEVSQKSLWKKEPDDAEGTELTPPAVSNPLQLSEA